MTEDNLKLTVTEQYAVYKPKTQGMYPVRESDWERIKRMVQEIVPHRSWLQIVASILAGICTSAVFTIVSLSASERVPPWATFVSWVALVVCIVLAPVLYCLDWRDKSMVIRSASSVVQEMELLEEGYEKSVGEQGSDPST